MAKPMVLSLPFWIVLLLFGACQDNASPDNTEKTEIPMADPETPPVSQDTQEERQAVPDIPIPYLLGQFDPAKDSNFVAIQSIHGVSGSFLHKETYEAFVRMYDAAKAEGVKLTIISATRNFERQKWIWENKWNGGRKVAGKNLALEVPDSVERARLILTYSSMPGTSRHHWGTDMDLNKDNNGYFASGEGLKVYEWLLAHAHEFGFCQPYSAKGTNRPYGYEEEKWHWSYLPLASSYLASYRKRISYDTLQGFLGAETAQTLNVIAHYVEGISSDCQ